MNQRKRHEHLKKVFPYSGYFFRNSLISLLLAVLMTACLPPSSQDTLENPLVQISTLPPWDGTVHTFTEGKYIRTEACGRVFDVQQTVYGPLTIGIAENFIEPQDLQDLAGKVIDLYRKLYNQSPIPLSHSISLYILPDPDNGQCYSIGSLVFVSPEELDSHSFLEQLLGAGTGIGEYWILNGLVSLISGKEPDREILKSFVTAQPMLKVINEKC